MKSILDPTFRYTNAAATDVRKTIKREQQRLEREAKEREVNAAEAAAKVSRIGGGK